MLVHVLELAADESLIHLDGTALTAELEEGLRSSWPDGCGAA